jgi:hypothetical protein
MTAPQSLVQGSPVRFIGSVMAGSSPLVFHLTPGEARATIRWSIWPECQPGAALADKAIRAH